MNYTEPADLAGPDDPVPGWTSAVILGLLEGELATACGQQQRSRWSRWSTSC